MTKLQAVRYEMMRRVLEFGDAHHVHFPETSAGGRALATVGRAVEQMAQDAAAKMGTARDGRQARRAARQILAMRLQAVVRTAKVIAQTSPGFDDPFQLPRPWTDQVLLTAARVFIREAEPAAAEFISLGLADAFIDRLREATQKLEAAINACDAGVLQQASARAGIAAALSDGLAAVRTLDVIVKNKFDEDVSALTGWACSRHLHATRAHRTPSSMDTEPDSVTSENTPPAYLRRVS